MNVFCYSKFKEKKPHKNCGEKKVTTMENTSKLERMNVPYFLMLPIYIFPLLKPNSCLDKLASHSESTVSSNPPFG